MMTVRRETADIPVVTRSLVKNMMKYSDAAFHMPSRSMSNGLRRLACVTELVSDNISIAEYSLKCHDNSCWDS